MSQYSAALAVDDFPERVATLLRYAYDQFPAKFAGVAADACVVVQLRGSLTVLTEGGDDVAFRVATRPDATFGDAQASIGAMRARGQAPVLLLADDGAVLTSLQDALAHARPAPGAKPADKPS